MTGQYFQTDEFAVAIPQPIARKPRIFVVQPQRLFMETLRQFLAADFEIAGSAESLRHVAGAGNLEVIVIDADAVRASEAFLVDLSRRSGALICLLSLNAARTMNNAARRRPIQVIPKSVTPKQLIERLLQFTEAAADELERRPGEHSARI